MFQSLLYLCFRKRADLKVLVVLFIFELVIPLIVRDYWSLRIIIFANIFVLYAVAYDLLAGYTGLISFGHSLFFGGAGYVAALLNLNFNLPVIICIVASCAVALTLGVFLGYVCLRLKGPYLAVVTLMFPLIMITIVHLSPSVLGGDNGIAGFAQLFGDSVFSQFYIVLVITAGSVSFILLLARGNLGLLLRSIREDEIGAEASGVNTVKYKVLAFVISGVFAGLAGALYVHIMGSVAPTMLSLHYAVLPIIMIFLGGASSILGPIIGAYIITLLDLYLLSFPYIRVLIYAAAIVLVLRFLPGGLMSVIVKLGGSEGDA